MITKKDIEELKKTFPTKEEMTEAIQKAVQGGIRDTKPYWLDEMMGEIKKMRDEVAIVGGYKDQIEDHEIRIETVEKRLRITP